MAKKVGKKVISSRIFNLNHIIVGLTQLDKIVADWLRKNNRIPTYVLVNKCESETVGITQAQVLVSLSLF